MEVAIFGGGVAGLMTAITLAASGHRCRIYEKSCVGQQAGMGFILLQHCIESLKRFGVGVREPGEFSCGVPIRRFNYRDALGSVLHMENMPQGAVAIRRRDLLAELLRVLPPGTVADGSLDELLFDSSGSVAAARLTSGEVVSADLYVAADGCRSRARNALFPQWPTWLARGQEVVGRVHCRDDYFIADPALNKFHAADGGLALGVLPVSADEAIWYLQFDGERHPSPPAGDGPAMHKFVFDLVKYWARPAAELVRSTDPEHVHLWQPIDMELVPNLHLNNMVLIGDAAHPLLPFSSQGLSSAIVDAVFLAEAITTEETLAHALAAYSGERRLRRAPFVDQGRALMASFLSPQTARQHLSLPIAQ